MNTPVLKSNKMRLLGFIDHVEEQWYYTTRLLDATSFNLTIDKQTGRYSIDILNEMFLQPEPYMTMRDPYKNYIKAAIDLKIYELNRAGLDLEYNHPRGRGLWS